MIETIGKNIFAGMVIITLRSNCLMEAHRLNFIRDIW